MIANTFYQADFVPNPKILWDELMGLIVWDERMKARKTASFGCAYNYSGIAYPHNTMPDCLQVMAQSIAAVLGFLPNNCLINYYPDGSASMGWHADQVDILAADTGIAIVSLGDSRALKFRRTLQIEDKYCQSLADGSLFYMAQSVQEIWQHAIGKVNQAGPRLSLTFRRIQSNDD